MEDSMAIAIAVLALCFSIGTFWWLNARRGRLMTWPPNSFMTAGANGRSKVVIPLVLYNSGASPITVTDLRLRMESDSDGTPTFGFIARHPRFTTNADAWNEDREMGRGFAVPGRTVVEALFEFQREGFDGITAPNQPSDYQFELWCRVYGERGSIRTWRLTKPRRSSGTDWRQLMAFPLERAVFSAQIPRSNTATDEPPWQQR